MPTAYGEYALYHFVDTEREFHMLERCWARPHKVGQNAAYNAANHAMIMTYWTIGKRIVEEEQSGAECAEYGTRLIRVLSAELTKEFGNSYSSRNLHYYRKFYQCFPDAEILNTCVQNLNWSHFRALLRVPDEDARVWYMNEAVNENWSVRTLDRILGPGPGNKWSDKMKKLCAIDTKATIEDKNGNPKISR